MSVDIYVRPILGWRFDLDEFESMVGRVVPAVTHAEKRFDPKTGERVEDEVVVDKPERRVVDTPDGEMEFNGIHSIEKVAKKVGLVMKVGGVYNDRFVDLGIDLPVDDQCTHGGMLHIRESMEFPEGDESDVVGINLARANIKKLLGIDLKSSPRFLINWSASY